MGRSLRKEFSSHGAVATGLARAGNGVEGPTTNFGKGDNNNKVSIGGDEGSDSWKKVGKDIGQKEHKTGGMSRKGAGVVGAAKASGSNY